MRIGFLQFQPQRKNIEENISKIGLLLAPYSFDLIVLPELANTGYLYANKNELADYSEPVDGSGKFLFSLIEIGKQNNACIVSGFSEIADGVIYNSAAAVSPDGVIGHYRKVHLYNTEKALFQPGNQGYSTFSYKGASIGMMICFDWIFPEAARTLALAGAQIIAHPANLVTTYCQAAMVTRSIENQIFTITANRYGKETEGKRQLTFTGRSQITSPKGELLLQADVSSDSVMVVDIDPSTALNKQFSDNNHLFEDRRPEFYLK